MTGNLDKKQLKKCKKVVKNLSEKCGYGCAVPTVGPTLGPTEPKVGREKNYKCLRNESISTRGMELSANLSLLLKIKHRQAICSSGLQTDYRGNLAMTVSGNTCQAWGSQVPQVHNRLVLVQHAPPQSYYHALTFLI